MTSSEKSAEGSTLQSPEQLSSTGRSPVRLERAGIESLQVGAMVALSWPKDGAVKFYPVWFKVREIKKNGRVVLHPKGIFPEKAGDKKLD